MLTYGDIDPDYDRQLSQWPPSDDGPIYMLNLMKYREWADYGPGGGDGDRISGRQADERYAPLSVLHKVGARVTLLAAVVESTEDWDSIAVVRYATRRSFVEMQQRADFQALHVHKVAGMDHTTIAGTTPVGALPPAAGRDRLLRLELWAADSQRPARAGAPAVEFTVEGTIVGDGRRWSTARYSVVDGPVDLPARAHDRQVLLVRPVLESWT